jgi:hypothetical protein
MLMNLADMLSYTDISELTKIAETYDCTCSSHSKNDLIQSILTTVQRKEVMESRVGEMTGNDLRFLNSLVFEGRMDYSLEELKARVLCSDPAEAAQGPTVQLPPPVPAAVVTRSRKGKNKAPALPPSPDETARNAILRFKRFGWLFNGFSQQTRYLFQVPEDVKAKLRDVLEKGYRKSLVITEEPPVYRDERSLFLDDLVHFLAFVRNHDLPLTSDGVMYKRQITQALELFSISESIPTRGGWRFGYGRRFRDYPDRFSLLYDYAYFQGYIVEQAEKLVLTGEGSNLLDSRLQPDPLKLYRFWLRLYKGAVPNLLTLVQWITRLSEQWVTIDSLYQILQPLIKPYYYDTQRDIMEQRVLKMLMHLGIVRWGEMAGGIRVVRITPQGKLLVTGS